MTDSLVRPLLLKLEPQSKADEARMRLALVELAKTDSTFAVLVDPESGETVLEGQSERHLDQIVHRLKYDHAIQITIGAPVVAYRETLRETATADFTYQRDQAYAHVVLQVAPVARGTGNSFSRASTEASIKESYAQSVGKGVRSVLANGILIGFPMMDVSVSWSDASFDPQRSSAVAFEIAARSAMREACQKAGIELLEPVMKVEVEAPVEFVGGIISDLHSRRGSILNQVIASGLVQISAHVPLACMFGYSSELGRRTHGTGQHTMLYDHYAVLPRNISAGPDDYLSDIGKRA